MKGMAAVAHRRRGGAAAAARPFRRGEPQQREPGAAAAAAPPAIASRDPDALEPSIYRFILRHSLRQQLLLAGADPDLVPVSLLLARTAENDHQPGDQSQHFPQTIFGIAARPDPLSACSLCVAFLLLVFINGAFKYYINTYKGQLGERMLRRFRYQLYQRLLRFPLVLFPARTRRPRSFR